MQRPVLAAVVLGGMAAIAVVVFAVGWVTPSEPEVVAPSPLPSVPAAAAPRPTTAPVPETPLPARPPPHQKHGLPTREHLVPTIGPRPAVDPDAVHDAEQRGVRAALFTRHPRLLDCHADHLDHHGPLDGRWTVEVTVSPGDDGYGALSVRTLNGGEAVDNLDACLVDALDDARFESPELPRTVRLPVPLPTG